MKLWAMPCRATQDGWVMVESSYKTWSTGEGNGKPLQYSCLENPLNSMKRQKDRKLKDELPRSVGAQYATGDQWRTNSRKNEETETKKKQHPVVDVTEHGSKVWFCKEQYCIGTWNVRSTNQRKFSWVQLLSHAWLLATPWTAARQPSLSITNSRRLLKLMYPVGDAIQPSHPLSSPSPAFNLSQHQGLFQGVSSLCQVAKVLTFQLQHQSFQWIFRTDFLSDWLVWSPWSPRDSQESSPTPQFKSINSSGLSCIVQLSHPYMTTGKTIALTRRTFVGKVMSLLFQYAV